MGIENWNDQGVKQIVENDIDSNGNEVADVICEQPENFVFLKKHKCASSTFQELGQQGRNILSIKLKSGNITRDWKLILDDN